MHLLKLCAGMTVFLFALMAQPAASQTAPSGSSSDNTGNRPSTFSELMDAIGSGSRLLIEQIQPGDERNLVDNPRFNSQENPRQSLMTFIEAMELVGRGYEEIGYERAMASLPESATRQDAHTLYSILLRLGPVAASELPGTDQIEKTGDTRYEFFPRGTEHEWVWDLADVPADAEISLVATSQGWLFSQATTDKADSLLEALSGLSPQFSTRDDGQYFKLVFAPLVEENSILSWGFFIGLTIIAFILGRLFAHILCRIANKAEGKNQLYLATTLKGFGKAGGLVIFTFLFTVAIGFLELGPVLDGLRYTLPRLLIIVAVAMLVVSGVDVTAAWVQQSMTNQNRRYDRMVITMIRRILRVLVITLIVIFILQNILGINIGALLVGFGFIALALSLAAQDSVKNFFGAVSIFINRPFVVGDFIAFRGEKETHTGMVEDIELQAVKLKDLSGNLITLPNMLFIDREVENLSARGFIRREVNIALPYRAHADEIDRALETLEEIFKDDEVLEDANAGENAQEPHVSFYGFDDSWLTIRGYHYYYMGKKGEAQRDTEYGWFSYLSHCSLVNRKIVRLFGERDIEFAFPTQTVEVVPQKGEPIEIVSDRSTGESQPAPQSS